MWTCPIWTCLHGLIASLLRAPRYLRSHQWFSVIPWISGVTLCESCISILSRGSRSWRRRVFHKCRFCTALARTRLKVSHSDGCSNCGLRDMVKIFEFRSAQAMHSLSANLMRKRGFKNSPVSWEVLHRNHSWSTGAAWPAEAKGSLHHSSEMNSHVFIWKSSCSVSIAICRVP